MLAACVTSSTSGIWTPTRIAREMGGLVSMIAIWHFPVNDCRHDSSLLEPTMSSATGPPLLTSGPCLTRFRDGTGGRGARVAAGGSRQVMRLCGSDSFRVAALKPRSRIHGPFRPQRQIRALPAVAYGSGTRGSHDVTILI